MHISGYCGLVKAILLRYPLLKKGENSLNKAKKPILDSLMFTENFAEKEKDFRSEIDYMLNSFIPSLQIEEWQKRYLIQKISTLKELAKHLSISVETGEESIKKFISCIPENAKSQIKRKFKAKVS